MLQFCGANGETHSRLLAAACVVPQRPASRPALLALLAVMVNELYQEVGVTEMSILALWDKGKLMFAEQEGFKNLAGKGRRRKNCKPLKEEL